MADKAAKKLKAELSKRKESSSREKDRDRERDSKRSRFDKPAREKDRGDGAAPGDAARLKKENEELRRELERKERTLEELRGQVRGLMRTQDDTAKLNTRAQQAVTAEREATGKLAEITKQRDNFKAEMERLRKEQSTMVAAAKAEALEHLRLAEAKHLKEADTLRLEIARLKAKSH